MRVAFGTDESTPLTAAIVEELRKQGAEVVEVAMDRPWPEVGRLVGEAVARPAGAGPAGAEGEAGPSADRGVVCCWTGTGVSIAANKVPGVRAALCTDAETARGARRWNDANVLAIGLRLTSQEVAREMLAAFLGTDPEEDERENISKVEPGGR